MRGTKNGWTPIILINIIKQNKMKDNKLIAEFMELDYSSYTTIYELKYHTSWDWLMPVVSKISSMCDEPYELDNMKHALLTGDIESVYYDVVEFIKQYNKIKWNTQE